MFDRGDDGPFRACDFSIDSKKVKAFSLVFRRYNIVQRPGGMVKRGERGDGNS